MQTFLPYSSFKESAKCLDYRRLGKQRVESYQLLQVLLGETKSNAWRNHPAVRMWRGYELALAYYGYIICTEWINRNYRDSLKSKFRDYIIKLKSLGHVLKLPEWNNDENFHASHRSNLLRKKFDYYIKYNWKENNNLPYIWPI